jgi:hypothetical protein
MSSGRVGLFGMVASATRFQVTLFAGDRVVHAAAQIVLPSGKDCRGDRTVCDHPPKGLRTGAFSSGLIET